MKLATLLFAAILALSGCAAFNQPGASGGKSLADITVADLDAAIAMAKAGNDPDAQACYESLKSHVADGSLNVQPAGVISGFEAVRLAARTVNGGVPHDTHVACAPVLVDANVWLVRLGVRAAFLR